MKRRDWHFIEGRLIAPCNEAGDAHARLVEAGEVEAAALLMKAMQAFTDQCRELRYMLRDAGAGR